MAMVNYPYNTSFITPMPAWPVNASCQAALSKPIKTDADKVAAIQRAAAIYYNYTGERGSCYDATTQGESGLDTNGWARQACNEMVMPFAQSGVSDMFLPAQIWDEEEVTAGCQKSYGLTPQYDWALDNFGGRNPKKDF